MSEFETLPARVDVAIVGAGSAGAAAALGCARRGLSALVIDRAPLARAGAHWVNAVPGRLFDEAEISRPSGAELESTPLPYHTFAGHTGASIVARGHDAYEVDMGPLVTRIQREAREAGATLVGGVRALGVEGRRLSTERGVVEAEWVVDASGAGGLHLLPEARTRREDLCSAAQRCYRVRDLGAARAFFERHEVPLGEVLVFVGLAGAYSTLNVRLVDDELSMLAGSLPALGNPSASASLAGFAAEHAWVGEATERGGARAIPLGRPADRLADGHVALLGDAARMVYSAHGSGVGAGLVAARILAEELAAGRGPAGYARRFMRELGGLLAGADAFRRFSQTLSLEQTARMMRAGLLDGERMSEALSQLPPVLDPRVLARDLPAASREPRLVAGVGGVVARMLALEALYRACPSGPEAQRRWARAVRRVAGEA